MFTICTLSFPRFYNLHSSLSLILQFLLLPFVVSEAKYGSKQIKKKTFSFIVKVVHLHKLPITPNDCNVFHFIELL